MQLIADEIAESDELEDVYSELMERVTVLEQVKRKKQAFEQRVELLEMLAVADLLTLPDDIGAERAEEIQLANVLNEVFAATNAYLRDAAARCDGSGSRVARESEAELFVCLQLANVVYVANAENDFAVNAFENHFADAIDVTLSAAADSKFNAQLRDAAIDATTSLIAAFPSLITRPSRTAGVDVRQFIIQECFALCAAADDDEFDPNAFSSANLGTQTLDLLAQKSPDEVAAAVLARVQRDGQSADENVRKSCLLALAVVPEPCTAFTSEHIAELFGVILSALKSESVVVRSAAFIASSEYVEHAQPAAAAYHEELLSAIWSVLDNRAESSRLQLKATIPLQQICKHISPQQLRGDDTVAEQLIRLIEHSRQHVQAQDEEHMAEHGAADWAVIEQLIIALRAIVNNAKANEYAPHARATFELLVSFMQSDGEQQIGARANATSAIGLVINALPKDQAATALATVVPLFDHNYQVDNHNIRASTHGAWLHLATALKADALAHIDHILPNIQRALDGAYGVATKKKKSSAKVKVIEGDEEDADEDEEDEEDEEEEGDEDDDGDFSDSGDDVDEERYFALLCWQNLIESIGAAFAPHHQRLAEILKSEAATYGPQSAKQVCSLLQYAPTLFPLEPPIAEDADAYRWTPAQDLTLTDDASAALELCRGILLTYIEESADAEVASRALETLTHLLKTFGQSAIASDGDRLVKLIKTAVREKLPSQNEMDFAEAMAERLEEDGDGNDEDDEEDENAEENEENDGFTGHPEDDDEDAGVSLQASALDCLVQLARVRGESFGGAVAALSSLILKVPKSATNYAYALGCLADVSEATNTTDAYVNDVVPAILDALESAPDNFIQQRNTAYAIGLWILKGGDSVAAYYARALTSITRIISECNAHASDDADSPVWACRDNAVSAVAKLIMAALDKVDANTVIPLVLDNAPLRDDVEEQTFVYGACVKLANTLTAEHALFAGKLIRVFEAVLAAPVLDDDVADAPTAVLPVAPKLRSFVATGAATLLVSSGAIKSAVDAEMSSWAPERKSAFESTVSALTGAAA